MSSDATAPDSFTPTADDDDAEQATESENTAGDGAGTLSRPNGVSNATNTGQSHKSTDRAKQRTDLRTADRHASWREVATACHVEAGLGSW
jgi:hypothetical protein